MAEKMGKRGEKAMEKSHFSVTCSLLSQYLKEKGGFGSVGLEMAPRPLDHQPKEKCRAPTTLSLLPGVDVSTDQDHADNGTDKNDPKSVELFPQRVGFDSAVFPAKEESLKAPPNNNEVEKSQLTIFYGGKVLVLDDFPTEKAKSLMQMAGKESIAAQNLGVTASSFCAGADFSSKPNYPIFMPRNALSKPAQANASDMPIPRRNSLHRFLEKRKDRISTKAPYQFPAAPDAAKPEARLGLTSYEARTQF